MPVPVLNLFANTVGGIGFIPPADGSAVAKLLQENPDVPNYYGRFYPKNTADELDIYSPSLTTDTPPWMQWEEMGGTDIWMIGGGTFGGREKILDMQVEVTHINVWDRGSFFVEDQSVQAILGPVPDDAFHTERRNLYYKKYSSSYYNELYAGSTPVGIYDDPKEADTMDPGIVIENNSSQYLPDLLANPFVLNGMLGLCQVSGKITDFSFYDHEMIIINGTKFGQIQYDTVARNYYFANATTPEEEIDLLQNGYDADRYAEILRVRSDGVWVKKGLDIVPDQGQPALETSDGRPDAVYGWKLLERNGKLYKPDAYSFKDYLKISEGGDSFCPVWDELTSTSPALDAEGQPYTEYEAGLIYDTRVSELDTIVITFKVACQTIIIPDDELEYGFDEEEELENLLDLGLEQYSSELLSNIWYFYMPVRYNPIYLGDILNTYINKSASVQENG